jgi:DNA/RNA endonuclease YhcR with UshA esterase domain
MRLLKGLIIILAIAGVGALVLASRASARPLTQISSINPSMNFAYVRVHGLVIDFPALSTADGYLSFGVHDQSGDIRVAAYRGTVEALLAEKRIPMPGTIVTIEGTLRVREDEPTLTLNAPEALDSGISAAQATSLGSLDAFGLGERATCTGQVRRVREVGDQYRIITLRDGATEADVMIPLQLGDVFGVARAVEVGAWIRVTGSVNEYRGRSELLVSAAPDVVVVQALPFETRPIAALKKGMIGQWVAVEAVVDKLRPIKQGMLLDLKDSSGDAVTVMMYEQWFQVPFSTTLHAGSAVAAQGVLVDFHGQLEVQVELSIDLVEHK